MGAVSIRLCTTATALALLYGCTSADVEEVAPPQTPSETAPDRTTETTPAQPIAPESGLGAANLLGAIPGGSAPAPDATVIKGRIFNGPYAVDLGVADRRRARKAFHMALEWLPVGRMRIWRNPANGHWGTVMPTRTYLNANGAWCREYRQTITLGGDENQETGAMCRGSDGVWQPVTS